MGLKDYREHYTPSGIKVQDRKSGEMKGTIGIGKKAPEAGAQPPVQTTMKAPAKTEKKVDSQYDAFLKRTQAGSQSDVVLMTKTTAPYDDVAYGLASVVSEDMDDIQIQAVYQQLARSLGKKVKNQKDPLQDPTDEQWQAWLDKARERLNDPRRAFEDEQRAWLLKRLDEAAAGPKPGAMEFGLASKFESRMWQAKFELDDGYSHIAAWYGTSPVNVKWKVEQYRKEYLASVAAGNPPATEADYEVYAAGFRGTQFMSPKDPATVWAHYKADQPEEYDPPTEELRYVAFDLETNGLDPWDANIIQVGLVEYDGQGNETGRFVSYVKPPARPDRGLTGSPEAVEVHGIKPKDVKNAPTFKDIEPKIREMFDGAIVVAQNGIKFDKAHLKEELARNADPENPQSLSVTPNIADTLWYAKRRITGLPKNSYNLKNLVDRFELGDFNAHDAGDDAEITAKVFFHLLKDVRKRQRAAAKARQAADPWSS